MGNIKVLIVDDHPIVCEGISSLLGNAVGIEVVGTTTCGEQALEMVDTLKPDVVLLDMEMPDINGVEVIKKFVECEVPVKVLGFSSYDDREYISQLLSMGASGYLIKDEVPETIVEAVRGVARGEKGWVSRKVASILSKLLQDEKDGVDLLSSRELEVLRLVVQAKTNAEIALEMKISVKTVEKHMETIFRKMGVVSRVEAAVMAVRDNLV